MTTPTGGSNLGHICPNERPDHSETIDALLVMLEIQAMMLEDIGAAPSLVNWEKVAAYGKQTRIKTEGYRKVFPRKASPA